MIFNETIWNDTLDIFGNLRHKRGQIDLNWRLLTGKWPQLTSFGTQSGHTQIFCMASFSHNGVPFVKIDQYHDSINYSNGSSTQWAIQRLICKRHVFDCPYDTKIFWWLFDDKILHKFVFRRFEDFNEVNFRMIVFDRFIPSEIDSSRSYILELIIVYVQYGFVYIQHWKRTKWVHWQMYHSKNGW